MICRCIRTAFRLATVVSFAVSISQAAPRIDLDRVTPVPANQPIPIQDFFRPPLFSSPKLNDAGTHLAALINNGKDKIALVVHSLDAPSEKPMVCTAPGDQDIYSFHWLSDKRLIFEISQEKRFGLGVYVANVESPKLIVYPALENVVTSFVGVPESHREYPLLWVQWDLSPSGDGYRGQVIELDTNLDLRDSRDTAYSGSPGDVQPMINRNQRHILGDFPKLSAGFATGYLCDRHGDLAFAFATRDGKTRLFQLVERDWRECPVDLDETKVVSYGDNPGEVIVRPQADGDKPRGLYFMDATTGKIGDAILADAAYDVHGTIIREPKTKQILGVTFERQIPATVWFIEDYKIVQKFLDAQFKGKTVRLWPADRTGKNFFVGVYSDRQPLAYYRVNLETRKLSLIENSAPWIDPERMRPTSTLKFKTSEGRQLDAYVTLPAGASKENPVPLIVLPHGGPWVRDTWGFDPEVQFLASRGYAVMQPNYRGSTGSNWMFPEDDMWAFLKMHEDVTAATKTVLKTGLIDRDRVAIMGASFGGYLAISGVVHEPSLYRCAITMAGVFDWGEVVSDAKHDRFDTTEFGFLMRRLGDPKKKPENYDAISPGRFVDRIQVPVFVIHDRDDTIASADESKRLIAQLRKFNKTHEVLFSSGEGHGPKHLKDKIEYYSRVEEFLAKNMAVRAAAQATAEPSIAPR